MFIIVVGSKASGKSTLTNYLINNYQFSLFNPVPSSDLTSGVTADGNWRRNLCIEISPNVTSELMNTVDQLRKRPFVLVVSVDGKSVLLLANSSDRSARVKAGTGSKHSSIPRSEWIQTASPTDKRSRCELDK
jgi:GTPase SAR1 family protein